MKLRNSFKRFISVSAMVAVLLSSASIMTTVNAEDAGIIKDDFSSSSYTSGVWTAVEPTPRRNPRLPPKTDF